jgi:hypothetical protein
MTSKIGSWNRIGSGLSEADPSTWDEATLRAIVKYQGHLIRVHAGGLVTLVKLIGEANARLNALEVRMDIVAAPPIDIGPINLGQDPNPGPGTLAAHEREFRDAVVRVSQANLTSLQNLAERIEAMEDRWAVQPSRFARIWKPTAAGSSRTPGRPRP